MRVVCVIFCAVLSAAAQTADIRPSFDAAVVKPSSAPDGGQDFDTTTGYLVIKNMNLKSLVGRAYSVREDQVSGGPKWVEEDRFNVEGRAAGPAKGDALLLMLQSLLAERFQLDLHREQKPIPVYALVQDKGGMKVQADTAGGGLGWNGTRGKIVAAGQLGAARDRPCPIAADSRGRYDRSQGRLQLHARICAGEYGSCRILLTRRRIRPVLRFIPSSTNNSD